MKPVKSHIFNGKRYRIYIHDRLYHADNGKCESPCTKRKSIHLRKSLSEEDFLEAAIDEAIHACDWHLDNNVVGIFSADIARFLRRLGYRRL